MTSVLCHCPITVMSQIKVPYINLFGKPGTCISKQVQLGLVLFGWAGFTEPNIGHPGKPVSWSWLSARSVKSGFSYPAMCTFMLKRWGCYLQATSSEPWMKYFIWYKIKRWYKVSAENFYFRDSKKPYSRKWNVNDSL